MSKIKTVRVYNSAVNYHNGENIGAGFAVLLDPPIIDESDIWKIADTIRHALEGVQLTERE